MFRAQSAHHQEVNLLMMSGLRSVAANAATLPNYPRRCNLIDYFKKSNFSKTK
jgi:hypothetical protein